VSRCSANLLDSQWSELLVTGHGPPQVTLRSRTLLGTTLPGASKKQARVTPSKVVLLRLGPP
jgi:hypothetical protein